jgi:hypothetical protein
MKKIHLLLLLLVLIINPILVFSQDTVSVSMKEIKHFDSSNNKEYLNISVDGLSINTETEGNPELPSKIIQILVPYDKEIDTVFIAKPKIETITLEKKIIPFQGKISTGKMVSKDFISPVNSIYDSESFYPEKQVKILNVDYFDYTNQIASIEVIPFQYNANKNILLFYSSFDIRIKYKNKKTINNKNQSELKRQRTEENQNFYDSILASFISNPHKIKVYSQNNNATTSNLRSATAISKELSYEYVVVTSSALAPAFERFISWKKRKGINIGIVTMEYIRNNYSGDLISGIYDDAGKLRQFLYDSYKNNLRYALLGGDKNNVPIRLGATVNNSTLITDLAPTDLYFADFNGNWNVDKDQLYGEPKDDLPDYSAEIYVGRILCSSFQDIENWTDKLIAYESNPGFGNFDYLKKAFYTQADQMQDNNSAATIKNAFSMFTTNTIFQEIFNGIPNSHSPGLPQFPTGGDVINEFNKNYGLVSFLAHGSPCNVSVANQGYNDDPKYRIFTSRDIHPEYLDDGGAIAKMTNNGYPNINYSISCTTMPFDDAAPWHEGHINLGKYYTSMFKSGNVAYLGNTRDGWVIGSCTLFQYFGNKITSGNYKIGIAEALSLSIAPDLNLRYAHNLVGDPEMEMWTDIPAFFPVSPVTENGNNITVNTGGVSGAKICVMSASDNGASYYQVADNVSSYTFSNVIKPYLVTISKHNYIPYLNDRYIQNIVYSSGNVNISGQNIYLGDSVTNNQTSGLVTVQGNANVKVDATKEIVLQKGFEVKLGASFSTR